MEYLFVDDVKHKVMYVNSFKNYVYYSYGTEVSSFIYSIPGESKGYYNKIIILLETY